MATPSTLPSLERSIDREASGAGIVGFASLWHLTSLDAPTVAVVWCLAFAWVARTQLPVWIVLVLALAAWAFYIGDRLLDARGVLRGIAQSALSDLRPRHYFHWRYRQIFAPLAIAASALALALVARYMPWAACARNSVLAAGALAYFTSVHSPWQLTARRFRLPKELLVGMLFTLACAAPTVARISAHGLQLLPLLLCFIALAWLNCHAIESWESVQQFRRLSVAHGALGLAASALLLSLGAASLKQPRPAALFAAAALSAALLALLDRARHHLSPTALRASADLVLLTPLALLVSP